MNSLLAWKPLGAMAPSALTEARLQLHWAIQNVIAVAESLQPSVEQAHPGGLEWVEAAGAFLTPTLGQAERRFRAGLRPVDGSQILIGPSGDLLAAWSLRGRGLDDGRQWFERAIRAYRDCELEQPLKRPDVSLPAHPVAHGGNFDLQPGAAFGELYTWFANFGALLQELRRVPLAAEPLCCWTESFELAFRSQQNDSAPSEASIRVGFSPGDSHHPEPFAFVDPGSHRTIESLPAVALPHGHWSRRNSTIAILSANRILEGPDEAQDLIARRFYRAAIEACLRG